MATEREDAGRFIVHADAHRDDGKRFVVRAEEKLTASVELEDTIWTHSSGRTLRINSIGDFFLKNQGLSPIGSRAASITIHASNGEPQNRDFLATEMRRSGAKLIRHVSIVVSPTLPYGLSNKNLWGVLLGKTHNFSLQSRPADENRHFNPRNG